ncbi:hypothetical protein BG004_002491 [Podila humilis]|nr:hypothetical protein BG004_002491 [Podila humilis]
MSTPHSLSFCSKPATLSLTRTKPDDITINHTVFTATTLNAPPILAVLSARARALAIPEILGTICQYLPRTCLPNARQTCRDFNQACLPYLRSKHTSLSKVFSVTTTAPPVQDKVEKNPNKAINNRSVQSESTSISDGCSSAPTISADTATLPAVGALSTFQHIVRHDISSNNSGSSSNGSCYGSSSGGSISDPSSASGSSVASTADSIAADGDALPTISTRNLFDPIPQFRANNDKSTASSSATATTKAIAITPVVLQEARAMHTILWTENLELLAEATQHCPNVEHVQLQNLHLLNDTKLGTFLCTRPRLRKITVDLKKFMSPAEIRAIITLLPTPLVQLTSLTLDRGETMRPKAPWTLLRELLGTLPNLLHLNLDRLRFKGHVDLDAWEQETIMTISPKSNTIQSTPGPEPGPGRGLGLGLGSGRLEGYALGTSLLSSKPHPLNTLKIKDAVLPMLRFFQLSRILPNLTIIHFDGFDCSPVPRLSTSQDMAEHHNRFCSMGQSSSVLTTNGHRVRSNSITAAISNSNNNNHQPSRSLQGNLLLERQMQLLADRVYHSGPIPLRRLHLSRAVKDARLILLLVKTPNLTELINPRPCSMYLNVYAMFPEIQLKRVHFGIYSQEDSTKYISRLTEMENFEKLEDLTLIYNANLMTNRYTQYHPGTISPIVVLSQRPRIPFELTLRRLAIKCGQEVFLNAEACRFYKDLLRRLPNLEELHIQEKLLNFAIFEDLGHCWVPDCDTLGHAHEMRDLAKEQRLRGGVDGEGVAEMEEYWSSMTSTARSKLMTERRRPLLRRLELTFDTGTPLTGEMLKIQLLKRFKEHLEYVGFMGDYPSKDWVTSGAAEIKQRYPWVLLESVPADESSVRSSGS